MLSTNNTKTICPVYPECPLYKNDKCSISKCIIPQQNIEKMVKNAQNNSAAAQPEPGLRKEEILLLKNRLASARNAYIKAEEEKQSVLRLVKDLRPSGIPRRSNTEENGITLEELVNEYVCNGRYDLDDIINKII